jgi:hypothetical protein
MFMKHIEPRNVVYTANREPQFEAHISTLFVQTTDKWNISMAVRTETPPLHFSAIVQFYYVLWGL